MKSTFKLVVFLIITFNLSAREMIIITYETKSQNVKYTLKRIKELIPQNLVKEIKSKKPCKDSYQNAILHLCFRNEKSFEVIRQKPELLKKSFGSFI